MINIGIDIDGCMNSLKEDIIKYGVDFFSLSDVASNINYNGYYFKEIFPFASDKDYDDFWKQYGYIIYTNPPITNVVETIKLLKDKYEFVIITSRNPNLKFNKKTLKEITYKWIDKYEIKIPVIFSNDKYETIISNEIDYMIEDKPKNISRIKNITNVLIYKHPYNENMDGIFVNNWTEIYNNLVTLEFKESEEELRDTAF